MRPFDRTLFTLSSELLVLEQVQRLGRVTECPGGLPRREHADEVVDERPVVGHAACEFPRMKTEQGIRLVVEHGLAAEAVFGTEQSRRFGDSAAHRGCVHVEMEEERGAADARPVCESDLGPVSSPSLL